MRRVLIVDDEVAVLKIISHFIERLNIPLEIIEKVTSGDEAIEKIIKLEPDIVFMDIQIPIYNGLEVIEKTNSRVKEINFIVITAFNYFEYAQKALRLGAKDILLKPIDLKEFTDSIEKVVGYKYTNSELLNQLLEYISLNYYKDLSLNECATKFLTNPYNISRLFKKHLDTTFVSYLNYVRIEKSIELLKNTGKTIQEVSESVGYNSLNNFYKNFKIFKGLTPKVYLNTIKQN
ncbi:MULTISPECIES: response regulator [unclassified Clostridioides]|uniref:response regulator transcription factor n=1 Tax=unclassified Clostridioides TaxID=2635829 RepID=UPI001D111FFB|nr:response regulator [Clostridioides sp. ES-S-0049-03]MCC0676533.1 response regulator [Clostridioides sp. ES-W-0018-02]MCC0711266.1 response regulator [Clostridioides sp. ES-W-0017-02]